MKKQLLMLCLLFSLNSIAQDREHKFASTLTTGYGVELEEYYIGTTIEYQMNVIYVKGQIATTIVTKSSDVFEFGGVPLGFNYHSRWNDYRVYAGLKLAVAIVESEPNAMAGIETGIDINITDTFFLGAGYEYLNRQDGKFHGKTDESFNDSRIMFKIGLRF